MSHGYSIHQPQAYGYGIERHYSSNLSYINLLSKKDVVICLTKLKYTWTLFLRSKDETPEVLKDFLTMIQRNLQALVISVRTDRGTEFLNKTLNAFFKEEGIEHQTSTPRTPEQNGIDRSNAWRLTVDRLQVWELVDKPLARTPDKVLPSKETSIWIEASSESQYPKGFGFDSTAFSDADHAGCVDTRKSTSRGIQFL
ncbi:retrovirus-related pol polyprotein from transposon TNT 1-94, partial [Tanacetum coccineum]